VNQEEASLIVRLMNTAANEGQGPDVPVDGDDDLLREAVALCGRSTPGMWWANKYRAEGEL